MVGKILMVVVPLAIVGFYYILHRGGREFELDGWKKSVDQVRRGKREKLDSWELERIGKFSPREFRRIFGLESDEDLEDPEKQMEAIELILRCVEGDKVEELSDPEKRAEFLNMMRGNLDERLRI